MAEIQHRFVDSTDGVRVSVFEEGNPDGPTLVLVHGWPDSHVLWDGVVPRLADRFRIIRYDNRGVGDTTAPRKATHYSTSAYADDFSAVIAELSPGRPVHVLAHDWGSISMWDYLARPGAADAVTSFTSVSGPSADHVFAYVGRNLRRPYRPVKFFRAFSILRLGYMPMAAIPVVGPLAVRVYFANMVTRRIIASGLPKDQMRHSDSYVQDATRSVKLYRANVLRALSGRRRDPYVSIPVQYIVNSKDPFIRPHVFDDLNRWVPRMWRRDIKAGHWSPMSHPQVLAQSVHEFVDFLDGAPPARALRRAQVGRPCDDFDDTLVSVTGAGSGIGRETALAFARAGAELIVSDIDEVGVKDTAEQIIASGGIAHPYLLDVADADAVDRFAEEVCAEHGVPDIVVNNAGIARGGDFLDTPPEQWDRVLDVNLGGVVNGCRAFAQRLVERGTGGHIVNISSMSAYLPAGQMNAYCTSKAAVYMFSDCLRAELSSAGIGLTTVCPGIVDTDIVQRAHRDSVTGSAGAERNWAKIEKLYQTRRYGPDRVAKAIVSAVKRDKAVRPVTPEAYVVYGLARILPQALRSAARTRLV